MAVPAIPKRPQRSWTEPSVDVGPGKWRAIYLLSALLAIGLASLIWWLFRQPAASITIFASLVVDDYRGDEIPNPAYARWEISDAVKVLGDGYDRSTKVIDPKILQGEPNIQQEIESINIELAKRGQLQQDTVVLYLRGQAIADEQDVFLLAGEFNPRTLDATAQEPTANSSDARVSMRQLLAKLQALPAANVVVLADFCDFTSAPKLGLIVNPVPRMLQKLCGELSTKGRRRLWVISASANMQPAHHSHHLDRTLLQSACEYACRPTSDSRSSKSKTKDGKISLGEFYEQVLRYSYTATTGDESARASPVAGTVQTPLLFRAGASEMCQPDSNAWLEAERVQMLVLGKQSAQSQESKSKDEKTPRENSPDEKKADSPKTKTARPSPRPLPWRWVAFQTPQPASATQSPTAAPPANVPASSNGQGAAPVTAPSANAPSSTSAASSSPAIAPQANPKAPANPPGSAAANTWDSDPWLRFWQLRDALAERKVKGGWSPADFAPHYWRQIQADALYHERLFRANAGPDRPLEMIHAVESLEKLLEAMREDRDVSVRSNSSETDVRLANAWNKFRQSPWLERKHQWESDAHWSTQDLQSWRSIRDQYRAYIDRMIRAVDWLDWAQSIGRQGADVASLASALDKIYNRLPKASEQAAIKYPIDTALIGLLVDAVERLDAGLRSEVAVVMVEKVRNNPRKLTWSDERLAELLLDSPLLLYGQRRELKRRLATPDYLIPGANEVVNKDLTVGQMLSPANKNVDDSRLLAERMAWCRAAAELLATATAGTEPLAPPKGTSVTELNRWGANYRKVRAQLPRLPSDQIQIPVARWQRACLVDTKDAIRLAEVEADILVRTSDQRGLVVKTDNRLVRIPETNVPHPIGLDVYTSAGATVRAGYLSWNLRPHPNSSLGPISMRSGGQTIVPGKWQNVKTTGNRIALDLVVNVDQSEAEQALELDISVSESPSGADARSVRVTVIPSKPSHVDLYVSERMQRDLRRAQPPRGEKKYSSSEELLTGQDALRVPAVAGASSLFDLFVVNRFGKPKRIVARLYAVPELANPSEFPLDPGTAVARDGRVPGEVHARTLRNIGMGALKPILESQIVELPSAVELDRDRTWDALSSEFSAVAKQLSFAKPSSPVAAPSSGSPPGSNSGASSTAKLENRGLLCRLEELDENKLPMRPPVYWHKWIDARPANPATDLVTPIIKIQDQAVNVVEKSIVLQVEANGKAWEKYGLEKIQGNIEVTRLNGTMLDTVGVRSIDLSPKKPVQLVQLKLLPKERERLDLAVAYLSIGGYPRAVAYQASFSTEKMDRLDNHLFGSVVGVEAFPMNASSPAIAERMGDLRIYPNRVPVTGKPPQDIEYQTIRLFAKADLPNVNSRDYEAVLDVIPENSSDPIGEEAFPYDRLFSTEILAAQDGSLALTASARELTVDISATDLRGRYRGEAKVRRRGAKVSEQLEPGFIEFVFDREPPQPSKVNASRQVLYHKQSIAFSIAPQETHSEIVKVEFRIDNNRNGTLDDSDGLLTGQVQRLGDDWVINVQADSFASFARNYYSIVARTVDLAGNEQSGNLAGEFQWMNAPVPSSVPKNDAKVAKSKAKSPPKPKLHNVRVVLELRGVAFTAAKSAVVQGLTSEDKKVLGNVWTFSGVPSGDYPITASYSGFTGEYEGKTAVSLTNSDGDKEIVLDLKPK